ncbi:chromatin subfamily A member 3-like 1 [Sesamum angolense]|uniref:Chromatin subfamily A member 3-like 1 n=1 Tax=Sesamum angolense TaxID=2727404 RepID=A0AAE1WFW1_9LAMI|nr:chromatin subfamily A member 3-like 1 [Sesamum angolense]
MKEIEAEFEGRRGPAEASMSSGRWSSSPSYDAADDGSSPSAAESLMVGFMIVNVVGLRHYSGTISGRELVGLVRDELNPYDGNAIKVLNMRSVQVGYLDRSAAAVLSPLIDGRLITIEGIVPKPPGKGNRFKIPCQVHIFARIEEFERVKLAIEIAEKSVDEIFKLLDLKVSNEGKSEALEPPKDMIKSELFFHQKEGLGWLVSRENSCELPAFWTEKDGVYVNVLTNYQTDIRPEPLRGGIFADDMGLGKTLTLLSLIAFDKWAHAVHSSSSIDVQDDAELGEEENIALSGKTSKRRRGSRKVDSSMKKKKTEVGSANRKGKRPASDESSSLDPQTTLIVCPPSVFSAWITQLEEHTRKGSFKVYMYYGERTKDAEELKRHDIVLTTYTILASEESWDGSPIKKIEWRRVILDEAHVIKNVNTQQSRAVTNLNAKRRWAVTGTPVQNNSFDLFSLVAFLRFEPLSLKSLWNSLIQRPLAQGDKKGITRLQEKTADSVLLFMPEFDERI